MAQKIFLVQVFLLALTKNVVDSMVYDCAGAKFGSNANRFDEFVNNCAPPAWNTFFQLPAVQSEIQTLSTRLRRIDIEPGMPLVFRALQTVAPDQIKVVIIGQDPTPQPGEATGLAFSVRDPRTVGSVLNVLLEVALEGWSVDISNGDLTKWANQGVLLLDSAFTVQRNNAGSHVAYWRTFTELLIQHISANADPSVWLLWGNQAQSFERHVDKTKHYVIKGGHPSALGGLGTNTFFGGNYFFCANQFLGAPIDWGLAVPNDVRLAIRSPLNPCPPRPVPRPATVPMSSRSKKITKNKGGGGKCMGVTKGVGFGKAKAAKSKGRRRPYKDGIRQELEHSVDKINVPELFTYN